MRTLRMLIGYGIMIGWTAYWGWSVYTETGLYAEAVRLMVDYFGSVDVTFTVALGWVIGLAVTAIPTLVIFEAILPKPTGGVVAPQPRDEKANERRAGVITMGLAVLAGAGGVGAYFYADTLPDGTEPPQIISASKGLPDDFAMNTNVILQGQRYEGLGAIITESGDSYRETHYVPVLPNGANPATTEVQFFEVATTREYNSTLASSLFADEGYITESRIELLARDVMEDAGITLAETTYIIQSSDSSPRADMIIMSYVAMGGAGLLFLVGLYLRIAGREKKTSLTA